ncbi:hypothetical protein [Pectinatus frisingensis]|uniref:hypothetical protein n=1 Tax=Pectinatus frisingensis TaxID=865 RepID=UPI0018C7DD08|nr:hypothetical protein [Pectinatus frisingensis]
MASEIDTAIINLDKKKILEICAENHINIPADEKQFWCSIHKVRLFFVKGVSKQLKEESRKYLVENDSPQI